MSFFFLQWTAIVSVFHLVTIAVHRYLYVCHHARARRAFTWRATWLIEAATWLFGAVVALPGFYLTDAEFDPRINTCVFASQDEGQWKYPLYLLVILLSIPCTVSAHCYIKIYRYVLNMKRRLGEHDRSTTSAANTSTSSDARIRHQLQQFLCRLCVFLVFLVMYLPFIITRILDSLVHVPDGVHLAFGALISMNSMINPIIYGVLNKAFRRGFKGSLPKCCEKRNKRSSQHFLDTTSNV